MLSDPTVSNPTFDFPTDDNTESVSFSLKVKDTYDLESAASVVVIKRNHPPDPVVKITPSTSVGEDEIVTLDASGSSDKDPGDKITSFTWSQLASDTDRVTFIDSVDGMITQIKTPHKPTTVHIQLALEDSHGERNITPYSIDVKCLAGVDTCPPVAVAAAKVQDPYIVLDASGSYDPNNGGQITKYDWIQIDNSGYTADIRGEKKDPFQYFVQPKVTQDTVLSFSLVVADNFGVINENPSRIDITIHPCSQADIDKVEDIENDFKLNIKLMKPFYPVSSETLELWMTGQGAKLYPMTNPRQLSGQFIRSSSEISDADAKLHHRWEGPHSEGTQPINHLFAFINQLPNDGKQYEFTGKATHWVAAIKNIT